MAGQAPHPPWFRMYFPSTRALAPLLPPPPPPTRQPPPLTRPPPPTPAITQTSIPIRQKMKESVPPPPALVAPPSSASAPQPKPPVSPPPAATSAAPPRSPIATFPTSTSTPPILSPSTSTNPKTTKTQVAASETLKVKVISRPTSSPKVIKPLESVSPQSLKTKQHLFNPVTLPPPAQINKTDGEKSMNEEKNVPQQHNHGIVSAGKRELTAKHEGLSDSEDDWMRVIITLAGENKGAEMELVPSNNKNHSVGNLQSRENGEEISKSSYKDENNTEIRMPSQGALFLNSNIQGLNNSVLCDCTYR